MLHRKKSAIKIEEAFLTFSLDSVFNFQDKRRREEKGKRVLFRRRHGPSLCAAAVAVAVAVAATAPLAAVSAVAVSVVGAELERRQGVVERDRREGKV